MTKGFDRQSGYVSRPYSCWRKCYAGELQPQEIRQVRRATYGCQFIGEPRWKLAVRGDAAAAIGIAIRVAVKRPCIECNFDLVMSVVFVAAAEGDAAARTFLAHMLRKRTAFDPTASDLADSWIAANRAAARAEGRPTPAPYMRSARKRRAMSRPT